MLYKRKDGTRQLGPARSHQAGGRVDDIIGFARPLPAPTSVVVLSARDISAAEREELTRTDCVLHKGDVGMQDITAEMRHLAGRS